MRGGSNAWQARLQSSHHQTVHLTAASWVVLLLEITVGNVRGETQRDTCCEMMIDRQILFFFGQELG